MTFSVKNELDGPLRECYKDRVVTIPCPGCGTRLNLSDPGCPVCLRKRTKYEITRGYTQVRADAVRRRRLPFKIIGSLAVLLALGRAASLRRVQMRDAASAVRARITRIVDDARNPETYAASKRPPLETPPPAPVPQGEPPPAYAAPAAATTVSPITTAPASPPDLPPPAPTPGNWVVHGRVFDLRTLAPAPGVHIHFLSSDPEGDASRWSVQSDSDGRYSIMLARQANAAGYDVLCDDGRYFPTVFHESDIPYARLPKPDRAALIAGAASGDIHSTPLADIIGTESRRLDLFLASRR